MDGITIVHAADLHLDSPFQGVQADDPRVAETLRRATFQAYDRIIDLCLRERVDALLVAGDVYDAADRSLRAQLRFREGLERLNTAGIRAFVCHGNHDPLDGWEYRLALPPLTHRFGTEVEAAPLDPAAPERGAVYGVSYPTQEVRENLALRFHRRPEHRLALGLLHANVGGNAEHAAYAPCSVDDLVAAGMDYWALGHVHRRQVLREQQPAVVYPGNPQGRHINEDGARGVTVAQIAADGRTTLRFEAVDVVRWARVAVSIADATSLDALLGALEDRAAERLAAADGRPVVCRVRVEGRGPLHAELQRVDAGEMREQLNRTFAARDPFLWCAGVETATAPPFDREEARRAKDLLGDALRLFDALRSDAAEIGWLEEQVAPLHHNRRLLHALDDDLPQGAALRALLDAAEGHVVDALLAADGETGG